MFSRIWSRLPSPSNARIVDWLSVSDPAVAPVPMPPMPPLIVLILIILFKFYFIFPSEIPFSLYKKGTDFFDSHSSSLSLSTTLNLLNNNNNNSKEYNKGGDGVWSNSGLSEEFDVEMEDVIGRDENENEMSPNWRGTETEGNDENGR